jgi:hypothetical protein
MTGTILSVHYSPGALTVLKRHPCDSWNHGRHRHQCSKPVETIVGVPQIVTDEHAIWCLSGCLLTSRPGFGA